jgi:hypothetical protein
MLAATGAINIATTFSDIFNKKRGGYFINGE